MKKIIFIIFLITACDFKTKPSSKSDIPYGDGSLEKGSDSVSYEIVPFSEPNSYSVRLKLKINHNNMWTLYREEAGGDTLLLDVVYGYETEYVDAKIEANKKYRYIFTCDNKSANLSTDFISIPSDIALSGQTIREDINANRVFLSGSLISGGEDIRIKANEIISNDALIDLSPLSTNLKEGEKGKNCGGLFIFANQGKGNLRIRCKAMDGAMGKAGRNGEPGENGVNGENGNIGIKPQHIYILSKVAFSFDGFVQIARSGNVTKDWCREYFQCVKIPTNGLPGSVGHDGGDGLRGGDGGDTGPILIKLTEESDFSIQTDMQVGLGGIGGPGGVGGRGGIGGRAGIGEPELPEKFHGIICPKAKNGPDGPDGKPGQKGPDGEKGKLKPVCIKNGGKLTGSCYFFGIYE